MKLKKSNRIYEEIKQFYDINPEGIYPYQNLDDSGRKEYRYICSSESSKIERWQKVNMSLKLVDIIADILDKNLSQKDLQIYLEKNPIILYYDVYIESLEEYLNNNLERKSALTELLKKIIKESSNSKIIKA